MFYIILIIIIIASVSFVIGKKSVKVKTFALKSEDELKDMRVEAREALRERTERRKEKILDMMKREAEQQEKLATCNLEQNKKGVTCNDVEELLDVSDQTACKYLNELEKEEKIEQIGTSGKGVYYSLAHRL